MDVDLSGENVEDNIPLDSEDVGASLPNAEEIKATVGSVNRKKSVKEMFSPVKQKVKSSLIAANDKISPVKQKVGEKLVPLKEKAAKKLSPIKDRMREDWQEKVHPQVESSWCYRKVTTMPKWKLYAIIGGTFLLFIILLSAGFAYDDEQRDSKNNKADFQPDDWDWNNIEEDGKYVGWAGSGDKDRYADTLKFVTAIFDYDKDDHTKNPAYHFNTPQNLAVNWIANMDKDAMTIPFTLEVENNYYFIQRYALAVLYYAMDGNNWTYKSRFLTKAKTCDWKRGFNIDSKENFQFGVECEDDEQISYLFMPGNGLRGTLPSEIAALTKLTHLSLFGNEIKGTIPDEFKKLSHLNFLAMESNLLSGTIPKWFGTSYEKMKYLALGDNYLTGTLPDSLIMMTHLEEVALDGNDLSGSVEVFQDLSKVRRLFLGENNFEGTIDNEFFKGSKIEELDIASNRFVGSIPSHFFNQNKLVLLDVHNNELEGPAVPILETTNTKLKFYSAYENNLNSMLGLKDLKKLTHLDLSANDIQEHIPGTELTKLTDLNYLFLSNNPFQAGTIPSELSTLTKLEELSLQHTSRTGTFPTFIAQNLTELVLLDLGKNSLRGKLPNHMDKLKKLEFLLLNQNQFTGTIKKGFKRLESLQMLLLDQNDIEGGANHVCDGPESLKVFSSDCPGELNCECCKSYCCGSSPKGDRSKNNKCYDNTELVANFDLDWVTSLSDGAGYARDDYVFSENLIFRPMSSDKDV